MLNNVQFDHDGERFVFSLDMPAQKTWFPASACNCVVVTYSSQVAFQSRFSGLLFNQGSSHVLAVTSTSSCVLSV